LSNHAVHTSITIFDNLDFIKHIATRSLEGAQAPYVGFVEHLRLTLVAQQSVTKIISLTIMNLATPKAEAEHELLFNNPHSVFQLCLQNI
jgi:hypothetical protein